MPAHFSYNENMNSLNYDTLFIAWHKEFSDLVYNYD